MMRSLLLCVVLAGCSRTVPDAKPDPVAVQTAQPAGKVGVDPGGVGQGTPLRARAGNELAVFAAGCFWGVEDMFRQMPGVVATAVGYTGGHKDNPSYEDVCSHTTGHAEAVLVEFDPKVTSYEKLLDLFFANHDPTSLNRQGPDVGSQYRSAVFTFSDAQSTAVRTAVVKHEAKLGKKIVTQLARADRFWKAEEYHQQYDEKHGTKSCPIGLPKGT
jgi:peptide-methionine (S)-S-oxide reductase